MTQSENRMPGNDWSAYLKQRERPEGPVVMYQRWFELLFLHWRFEPSAIQATLPPSLTVDTYDGSAWVGVVPFQMQGVRPRFLPKFPGLSNFPELNLRTYVIDAQGRPGVWFYSLDTSQPIANWIARTLFHLNYRRARFALTTEAEGCRYQSELRTDEGWAAKQTYTWRRSNDSRVAEIGSLEFFLVERYRLFAYDWQRDRLFSGQVHHPPYSIESAEIDAYSKFLFESNGLNQPAGAPDHILASPGVDVRIFPLRDVSRG